MAVGFQCPTKNPCPDVTPLQGFSSEQADSPVFISTNYGFDEQAPPLGSNFQAQGCQATCESILSQEDADECAERAQVACLAGQWGQNVFFNGLQSCAAFCPDGLPFVYAVPAGRFAGLSQAEADAIAESQACELAQLHLLCLSNIPNTADALVPYSATITATSAFLAGAPPGDTWRLVTGALPPGLSILEFGGGTAAMVVGGSIHIVGTPTKDGTFSFVISITLPNGDSMTKIYTITVFGVFLAADPTGIILTDELGDFLMADL